MLPWLVQVHHVILQKYNKIKKMEFQYIKDYYNVPANMFREVTVSGEKGVITQDMGNYIGVTFYDRKNKEPFPCHPTWEVVYLETFNPKPPKNKNHRSKQRYRDFLDADNGQTFAEFIGVKKNK